MPNNQRSFPLPFLCLLASVTLIHSATAAPQIVLIHGESEHGSARTIPALAGELESRFGYETVVLTSPEDSAQLPDLTSLTEADLLVLLIGSREATEEQHAQLRTYFDAGKPALAFRATSHGFSSPNDWFTPLFGGQYRGQAPEEHLTTAVMAADAVSHPIMKDVKGEFHLGPGGMYFMQPLSDFTYPLVFGKTENLPAEPLAWTASPKTGQRLFYTSLGTEDHFKNPAFRMMILNACRWCLGETPSETAATNSAPDPVPAPPERSPAADATVLFDGGHLDQWRHWDPGTLPGASYRDARWQVDGHAVVARPGYGDIITRDSYGDAVYHIDFLIPREPAHVKGQFRGNGGVCIEGKWEIQIIDSHGDNRLHDQLTCGAIYGLAAPTVNACREPGIWQAMDVAVKHEGKDAALLSVWLNGRQIHESVRVENSTIHGSMLAQSPGHEDLPQALFVASEEQSGQCSMAADFTVLMRFRTRDQGPLFSKVHSTAEHRTHDKVLFIADNRLHYDIGWVGVMASDKDVNDGDWHTLALRNRKGITQLYVDGEKQAEKRGFTTPDSDASVIKIGAGAPNFPNDRHWKGGIGNFQFFTEALGDEDLELAAASEPIERMAPVLHWQNHRIAEAGAGENATNVEDDDVVKRQPDSGPGGPLRLQADTSKVRFANISVRPLAEADHAGIINAWDDAALARGQKIYQGLCFACHGNLEKAGSLPTSRPFWKEPFKNGKDPYSLYLTLKKGYNQMPPQPWLTPAQAYDVIHYIREEFVRNNNSSEYAEISPEYLASLPKGIAGKNALTDEQIDYAKGPRYLRMDFGPMLDWTFEVAPENIAYKGIAVRLDEGPGGVSKGRHWMVYDHDTMRVAAAWSGSDFIDWKGIAFDQSHGTHTSIVGDKTLVNPVGPGWANPADGSWADPRFLGRDGKPYGPLPRSWTQFKGQYIHGRKVVLKYTVGDAAILEMPGLIQGEPAPIFLRTLNIGKSSHDLQLRVSPAEVNAWIAGDSPAKIEVRAGYQVMTVAAQHTPLRVNLLSSKAAAEALFIASLIAGEAEDLTRYTTGGPTRWTESVVTQGKMGNDDDPFAVDEITYPKENPWHSWMRIGGFDFLPGGKRAAVATWLGDVWLVDGIDGDFTQHRWKRICTGLFQPLGVKWSDGYLYITCRDQLAKLHDFNGDEEIDFVECFNNDHQVTEHFHEFAMGLQTDDAGNFYYAKSARHAKTALVPHHGTLLRVSKDGSQTEILATGFRAANGVCLNPDGTYIVTDQEGHWNPKNRINYVKEGGFYGNMYGYHNVTDSSDEAMEQPLCWITNAFDRSPGELLWVPEDAGWGALNGTLLNLSYGTGHIFAVPHEKMADGQAQGGMVSLGLDFPTGIMRGRFHPDYGQLYTAGMFAWAGSKHQDGGFYRVRATGSPMDLPIDVKAKRAGIELGFSDPLDPVSAGQAANYQIKIWGLKRTKDYGSKHYNERPLEITAATVSEDGHSVFLTIPEIAPTWCMEIKIDIRNAAGQAISRVIHNTIHQLGADLDEQT